MGPSSKSRLEFVHCENCGCTFSSKHKERHDTSVCQDLVNTADVDHTRNVQLQHGFIKERCLIATSKYEEMPKHLPKNFRNDVVLLHPTAMQLLGISLGGPVIVSGQQGSDKYPRVLNAWPNPVGELAGIGFISSVIAGLQPIQTPTKITVSPLDTPYCIALEVRVKPREIKTFLQSPEFMDYIHRWCDGRFLTAGNKLNLSYYGQPCQVEVINVSGNHSQDQDASCIQDLTNKLSQVSIDTTFYSVVSSTRFVLDELVDEAITDDMGRGVSLEQVGGLGVQVEKLKELLDLHFKKQTEVHQGLSLPKGILLHGPSGTGKTLLARALITYAGVNTIEIQGTEIWSKFYGDSETKMAAKFQEAKNVAPSIIFIDELDSICPQRSKSQNEVEKRVVSSLMTLMDRTLSGELPVVVIGATNKREDVDPGLRRPGRLEREVEIGVPSASDRLQILEKLLLRTSHSLTVADLKDIADQAHGFVGADLAAVCKEAGIMALKCPELGEVKVKFEDVRAALQVVQPSAMREVALEISKVGWDDIGGQTELKHKLRQAIEWPLLHPESFTRLGIHPPRGLLMYGPPGCSKTMVAKALARESGLNFIAIKGPELFSKWVGESERAVREVFRKARAAAPAIIFFDEVDSIAGERGSHGGSGGGEVGDRVLAQLLTEIDGVVALKDVTIVAATNRPERIDKALLRPGRLDRIVYVPLPDKQTRMQIFEIHFRKTPVAPDVAVDWLVERTERYSGAEVSAVCHEAALSAMQEDLNITNVHRRHFETALTTVTPRISPEVIKGYDEYAKHSGLHSL